MASARLEDSIKTVLLRQSHLRKWATSSTYPTEPDPTQLLIHLLSASSSSLTTRLLSEDVAIYSRRGICSIAISVAPPAPRHSLSQATIYALILPHSPHTTPAHSHSLFYPRRMNQPTGKAEQELISDIYNDPIKHDEDVAVPTPPTSDLVVSAYVGLTTAQAIRKFYRLYFWGLAVTFAGM